MYRLHRSPKLLACCALALLLAAGAARDPVVLAYTHWYATPAAAGAISTGDAPARILAGADVRSGPGERYLILAVTQAGGEHAILGRSSDGLWWRIDYRGLPAWVAAAQMETQATNVPVVRVGGDPDLALHHASMPRLREKK